jgi:hypothetical protein
LVAPTNAAFAKLSSDAADFLTSDAGKDTLVSVLLYHVFPGVIVSTELTDGSKIRTVQGEFVNVRVGPIMFNNARAVEVDILANNGVIHKIDTVLIPSHGVHPNPNPGKGKSSKGKRQSKKGGMSSKGKGKSRDIVILGMGNVQPSIDPFFGSGRGQTSSGVLSKGQSKSKSGMMAKSVKGTMGKGMGMGMR